LAKIRTAARSYLTRKRAFNFYSPGVVRRSRAAAGRCCCGSYISAAAVAAAAAMYIGNLMIKN